MGIERTRRLRSLPHLGLASRETAPAAVQSQRLIAAPDQHHHPGLTHIPGITSKKSPTGFHTHLLQPVGQPEPILSGQHRDLQMVRPAGLRSRPGGVHHQRGHLPQRLQRCLVLHLDHIYKIFQSSTLANVKFFRHSSQPDRSGCRLEISGEKANFTRSGKRKTQHGNQ